MKTLNATSSRMKKSKEKERPLHRRLQAKKTASQQPNRKPKKALYLLNNRETDSVSETTNQKK
jgi:hypothetical protein